MAFGVLMGQIAVIFLEVLLGLVGAKCRVITDRDSKFLSDFVMKLLLPSTAEHSGRPMKPQFGMAAVPTRTAYCPGASPRRRLTMRLLPLDNALCMGLSIIASCPAGSLAAVVAKQTGTEETLASQAVAHSTLCMLVTVPAMLMLAGVLFPL